jgi:lipopolysaccharide/colanic/teichoic acid biosynthesis glycosyltransferase
VSQILGKTKININELPQLLNVLFGQMSFVASRLFVDDIFAAYYPKHVQDKVCDRPTGLRLTCLGSIVNQDEEAIISASCLSLVDFYREVIALHIDEFEFWCQTNQSFLVYFKVLIMTGSPYCRSVLLKWSIAYLAADYLDLNGLSS